jgi:hypothetical protein
LKIHHHFSTRQRKLRLKLVARLLMGLSLPLLLQHANAADVSKKIIVTSGVEYDSNPAMAQNNRKPVWTYTLVPRFLIDATDEVNRWFLDAALQVQKYSNDKVLGDREDPRLTIGWDHRYESGFFGIKADYQESSSRIAELKTTGVFSNKDATQKTKVLAANWQHAINPRWTVLTEGSYTDTVFSQSGDLGSYNVSDIGSKLTYAYTEKLDTSVKLGYAHFHPDVFFDDTDLVRLVLGANYQINEGFNLAARAGVYNLSGQQSDTDWEAGIKAEYKAERMNYTAELNRELAASGAGGFQKTDSLKLTWLFDRSEYDRIGAEYGIYKYKEDAQINLTRVDSQQLGAFYERSLSNHWQSRFYVVHKELDSPQVDSRANVIGVSLAYDTLSF